MVKEILFIQSLATLILGIYLTSLGLPPDETSLIQYAHDKIMDSLVTASNNNSNVQQIANSSKSTLESLGLIVSILSFLELGILIISMININ